jgi:hypothetical protein
VCRKVTSVNSVAADQVIGGDTSGKKSRGWEQGRKPPDLRNDRGLPGYDANRTSGCGLGMSGWLAPERGEGEAFVIPATSSQGEAGGIAPPYSLPRSPAAPPIASAGLRLGAGAGTAPRRVYDAGQGSGAFSVLRDLRDWPWFGRFGCVSVSRPMHYRAERNQQNRCHQRNHQ